MNVCPDSGQSCDCDVNPVALINFIKIVKIIFDTTFQVLPL